MAVEWNPSNPGSRIREIRSPIVKENGRVSVEVTGKEDWQEYIDSFADSVDLAKLVARFQNGDLFALERVQGTYGDFTVMPKTYAEFLQKYIDARNIYEHLPSEIQDKFGSVEEFLVQSVEPDFEQRLGINIPEPVVKESVENES